MAWGCSATLYLHRATNLRHKHLRTKCWALRRSPVALQSHYNILQRHGASPALHPTQGLLYATWWCP
ncbi:hypothetical protein Csa_022334 [Cucumis sativus]|uniref:Uncharacterized protein n=1 Tax=Cucumis sativus TaxID=3659 RepID=A0A0A0LTF4_CUCSA|nr:hypothetical protein Csa_022334 [Cucumis sativus]